MGSIYGPNDENKIFCNNLVRMIRGLSNGNIIIGGDWNATWDNRPVEQNIDVINMREIPNRSRSNNILNLCRELNLVDPFRIFHPVIREFTYIPNARENTNRSRLDFFCVSENISAKFKDCYISQSTISNTFDHKQILLSSKTDNKKPIQTIKDHILKDPDLNNTVKASVFDCYMQHASDENFMEDDRVRLSSLIGRVFDKIKRIKELLLKNATENLPEIFEQVENERNETAHLFEQLPELVFFENLSLTCDDDSFFEVLAMTIKMKHSLFKQTFLRLVMKKKHSHN